MSRTAPKVKIIVLNDSANTPQIEIQVGRAKSTLYPIEAKKLAVLLIEYAETSEIYSILASSMDATAKDKSRLINTITRESKKRRSVCKSARN